MIRRSSTARRARGFSLIVSLILLVVITVVALTSMRSVALEARMSAATYDRNLAFQAAETGLREAEARAMAASEADFPNAGCVGGYCAEPAPGNAARWANDAFAGWLPTVAAVSDKAITPEAIIEDNGVGPNWPGCAQVSSPPPNCVTPRYRVTGRSVADGRANVLLQSDVARD